ncbi:hypothetical protein ACF9IK_01700 [Kitasatospora hibisci]|uniref:hypothetical protein n=1 Tax=Kitasatospora hibisci TaxID=3369522 RepID=UPI0037552B3D
MLFTRVFPGEPAEPPQSFGDLSDVQQRVVRFVAGHGKDARSHPAMGPPRNYWLLPGFWIVDVVWGVSMG